MTAPPAPEAAPGMPPRPLLVLTGAADEAAAIARALGARNLGGPHRPCGWGERDAPSAVVAATGMGPERAATAAIALIARFAPKAVVSAGTCGGLAPGMAVGDWVATCRVVPGDEDDLGGPPPAPALSEAFAGWRTVTLGSAPPPQVHDGPLASIARGPLRDPAAAASLVRRTGAVAVDMESLAIARAATDSHLEWVVLRVVIDTPADPLPPFGPPDPESGRPPTGRLAAYLARHPLDGPRRLFKLKTTLDAYASHLAALIRSWLAK